MSVRVCRGCDTELPTRPGSGRQREWCSDYCRKQTLYSRPCVDCGKPLNGSDGTGPNAPQRCIPCSGKRLGAENKVWTRDALICAIRDWAAEFGESPAVPDWDPYRSRHYLHDEARAVRFEEAGGRWPSFKTVVDAFGTWNAGLTAAGFATRAPHGGDGNQFRARRMRAAA